MMLIDRYMARTIATPLLASFVIAAMLLVLDRINSLLEFVATKGGPIGVVWRMLANLLPEYLGLSLPLGLLLGILLAFRRLAINSELDVMRAVGISYTRLLRVPYLYAVGLAIANIIIVSYIQPEARYAYADLRFELQTGALGASIKIGEFNQLGSHLTLRIERSEDKGRKLSGVFVHLDAPDKQTVDATAEHGEFMASDDPNVIILHLENGTLINNSATFKTPRVLTFSSYDYPISLPKLEQFRKRGERNLELTLPELIRLGHDKNQPKSVQYTSRAAFHFRIVEVCTIFLLPLLGVALGVPPKRSSSGLGVFLAIVMLVAYHKINEYGQDIGGLGKIDPVIALWLPFALFAGLVIWMYYRIAYVPGGQPIGALERAFAKLGKALARALPRRLNR